MGLTMTRTRTQTTLTRLVTLLANLNRELKFVDWLMGALPDYRKLLALQRKTVAASGEAVAATLRQFDPTLNVEEIVASKRPRSRRDLLTHVEAIRSASIRK